MYSQAGALAFTSSLTTILGQAGLVREGRRQQAPQPTINTQGAWQPARGRKGFRRNQHHQDQFTIPTMNRFQGFC